MNIQFNSTNVLNLKIKSISLFYSIMFYNLFNIEIT